MPESTGPNLTFIAYFCRQAIKFGGVGLVLLIVGRTFLTASLAYWKATHPPAPPPPTVGFEILPPIRFPEQTADQKPLQYTSEVVFGRLPIFPDRAKVFLMPKAGPSLYTEQRAKEVAANYGFPQTPTMLDDKTYRWTKSVPLSATLQMDVLNYSFSINTNYLSKPELIADKNLPGETEAITLVKSFIGAGQTLPPDIATSSGSTKFLKSLGGELSEAVSYSDADFIQVDVQRVPVDGDKPFYTPKGTDGIIHAVVSGSGEGKDQIVQLDYNYRAIDYLQRHTYPILTVQQAWDQLKAGKGYVVNKGAADTAVVRNISLGYYDDTQEQEYMQPIYVFEGDDGFMAFLPAITPRWYPVASESQGAESAVPTEAPSNKTEQ